MKLGARFIPNQVPARGAYVFLSLVLFAWGTYGIWVNDLFLPVGRHKYRHPIGIHFRDSPAWILYGAILCACCVMLSFVIDHYDRRNNEQRYRRFANTFMVIGWCLFMLSFVFKIFQET